MEASTKARWLEVCAEAAICEDSERLGELAAEIITILHEEEQRLEALPPHGTPLRR